MYCISNIVDVAGNNIFKKYFGLSGDFNV